MHVQTDPFCSAGLVLPDKAGRQIDLAGWNASSMHGVRLYTPSGSAGVWGTTDWEEDPQTLTTQVSGLTFGSQLVVFPLSTLMLTRLV